MKKGLSRYRFKKIINKLNCPVNKFTFILIISIILVGFSAFLAFFFQVTSVEINKLKDVPPAPHRSGPIYTKGIYITSWTASENSQIDKIINSILEARLNTVVIDIKDASGWISYWSQIPQAQKYGTRKKKIKNINELLNKFHQHNIYVIARIVVFQDPVLSQKRPDLALKDRRNGRIWHDFRGQSYLNPSSKEVWAYNIDLAKEAFQKGFDEVNFDYVRFPSDGLIQYISYPISNKKFSKYEVIRSFFKYQKEELAGLGPTSLDIFGLTLWHFNKGTYDMGIGQRLIDALDYFDYICPMLYPSHFPEDFAGFHNPAEYPYEIIYSSLDNISSLLKDRKKLKIRPWLQAFDIGAKYTPEMILKEITAVKDGGGYGWLFWNSRNDYSSVVSALKK